MKTIREWLQELPDGIRERAIRNTKERRLGQQREGSLPRALKSAFNWYATEEKVGFWVGVYAKVMGYRDDWPPIPDAIPDPVIERLDRIEAELRRIIEILTTRGSEES